MQDKIDPMTSAATGVDRADILLDKVEPCPSRRLNKRFHFFEITPVAGGEIVKSDHALIEL
jgi:hypothetical protein